MQCRCAVQPSWHRVHGASGFPDTAVPSRLAVAA